MRFMHEEAYNDSAPVEVLMAESWFKKYMEEIVIGLLVCVIWAGVAWLFHENNTWARPIFYGLVVACLLLVAYSSSLILRRIPPSRIRPSEKNIESCVRSWLDNHRISVQNDPSPETFFRLRIMLNEKAMTVLRMRDESKDYVQILADLGTHGDNKILEGFTEDDIAQIIWDVRVELARAKVGYSGLVNPPDKFMLIGRVPIHHNLTEFIFMSMVGSVEAGMNLVGLMLAKTKLEVDRRKLAISGQPTLPS